MPKVIVEVTLPLDRRKTGQLSLKDETGKVIAGPFSVLGKSSNKEAAEKGNPTSDPKKLWGDTPEGTYTVPRVETVSYTHLTLPTKA